MSNGKRGVRILVLSLLTTLGLMAAGVAGAQAGEFLIEENGVKKTFAQHNLAMEEFSGSIGENELLVEGGVKVFCNNGELKGTFFKGGKVNGKILFGGCSVLEEKKCIVYETELSDKMKDFAGYYNIETTTGEAFLHNSAHYIWFEGEPLGVIWFGDNGAEECPLPLSEAVSGSFAIKLPTALAPEVFQGFETITAAEEASIHKLFPELGLFLGNEEAHYKAGSTGSLHLTGTHGLAGKKWGAI
jgi:hypothetical protein